MIGIESRRRPRKARPVSLDVERVGGRSGRGVEPAQADSERRRAERPIKPDEAPALPGEKTTKNRNDGAVEYVHELLHANRQLVHQEIDHEMPALGNRDRAADER
jgi:hypothetical protein